MPGILAGGLGQIRSNPKKSSESADGGFDPDYGVIREQTGDLLRGLGEQADVNWWHGPAQQRPNT